MYPGGLCQHQIRALYTSGIAMMESVFVGPYEVVDRCGGAYTQVGCTALQQGIAGFFNHH